MVFKFVMLFFSWIFRFALDLNIYSHRKHLKPISSCFLFKNIQVCTGCEQLFRERTIKPISSYFLSHEYSGLYWIWTIIHKENTWNQFCHAFCLVNIQVCTGSEQLFTERHLKPISPCFLSSEDKRHGEISILSIHLFWKFTSGPPRNLGAPWSKILASFGADDPLG